MCSVSPLADCCDLLLHLSGHREKAAQTCNSSHPISSGFCAEVHNRQSTGQGTARDLAQVQQAKYKGPPAPFTIFTLTLTLTLTLTQTLLSKSETPPENSPCSWGFPDPDPSGCQHPSPSVVVCATLLQSPKSQETHGVPSHVCTN